MKPTVSESTTVPPVGISSRRVVESSVLNNWSSTRTLDPVSLFSSDDLPLFV